MLLLMTNRKSYTGFRSASKSTTVDDLEHQNRGFLWIFGYFGLQDTFQERVAPKSTKIDNRVFPSIMENFRVSSLSFSNPAFGDTLYEDCITKVF